MSQIHFYKPQNRRSLLAIHSTTAKRISWACTMKKTTTIHEWKSPALSITKTTSHPWGKMKKTVAHMRENTQVDKKCEGESSPSFHCVRKWRTWVNNKMGMQFWVLTCHISQNTFFQKWVLCPIRILTSLPFPSQENNFLNQFLAVINDWVNKTRKVFDSLMGFIFDIWIFPIGSRFEYPLPYP